MNDASRDFLRVGETSAYQHRIGVTTLSARSIPKETSTKRTAAAAMQPENRTLKKKASALYVACRRNRTDGGA